MSEKNVKNAHAKNFNRAMFEMFGVGDDEPAEKAAAPAAKPSAQPARASVFSGSASSRQSGEKTYLAPGTTLIGTLKSANDVDIAGTFEGDIICDGKVTLYTSVKGNVTAGELNMNGCKLQGDVHAKGKVCLGEQSEVRGSIYAGEVECHGSVIGDLDVEDLISVSEKARIEGNVAAGSLMFARGARVNGNVKMRTEGEQDKKAN